MDIEDKINNVAMSIIMNAGDARVLITESFAAMESNQFPLAEDKIHQAQEKIKIAHSSQTDIVQGEIRGEVYPASLLFTHAQDTLMTINSELIMSRHLLRQFRVLNERLQKIESAAG
ncbi:PTS lactose/cellobiose transporter subunit IIA [Izhakiella australiensis]|nr:PTS lactose/cellobiose transporter subunit IIA [Izhakiella australiensis]